MNPSQMKTSTASQTDNTGIETLLGDVNSNVTSKGIGDLSVPFGSVPPAVTENYVPDGTANFVPDENANLVRGGTANTVSEGEYLFENVPADFVPNFPDNLPELTLEDVDAILQSDWLPSLSDWSRGSIDLSQCIAPRSPNSTPLSPPPAHIIKHCQYIRQSLLFCENSLRNILAGSGSGNNNSYPEGTSTQVQTNSNSNPDTEADNNNSTPEANSSETDANSKRNPPVSVSSKILSDLRTVKKEIEVITIEDDSDHDAEDNLTCPSNVAAGSGLRNVEVFDRELAVVVKKISDIRAKYCSKETLEKTLEHLKPTPNPSTSKSVNENFKNPPKTIEVVLESEGESSSAESNSTNTLVESDGAQSDGAQSDETEHTDSSSSENSNCSPTTSNSKTPEENSPVRFSSMSAAINSRNSVAASKIRQKKKPIGKTVARMSGSWSPPAEPQPFKMQLRSKSKKNSVLQVNYAFSSDSSSCMDTDNTYSEESAISSSSSTLFFPLRSKNSVNGTKVTTRSKNSRKKAGNANVNPSGPVTRSKGIRRSLRLSKKKVVCSCDESDSDSEENPDEIISHTSKRRKV